MTESRWKEAPQVPSDVPAARRRKMEAGIPEATLLESLAAFPLEVIHVMDATLEIVLLKWCDYILR